MDIEELQHQLYILNEDELLYKKLHTARMNGLINECLKEIDIPAAIANHMLIPEVKETIPEKFLDSFFFDMSNAMSIIVQKHNRYSPALVHSHTFFELVYVYDGDCTQDISGQVIQMRTGDFCVIPPGVNHSISVFNNSIIFNVMLRRDTMHSMFYGFLSTNNLLSSFLLNNIYAQRANDYILFHTGKDNYIKTSFIWMYLENINQQRYSDQCISSTLLLDFYLIIRDYESSAEMPLFDSKMDVQRYALLQFIQDNFKDITLTKLAEKFHYSNEYASRLIKELTGMTYTDVVRTVRIERSQDFLENTTMTVASIAEAIGYDTTEHYIRQFKKHTGMTPSSFRKQSSSKRFR